MVEGIIISANLGNFLPTKFDYTCSLSDKKLAHIIHQKIEKINPDICVFQEVWNFTDILVSDNYEFIGLNDSIAVKKSFAEFIPDSFKSHSIHFKKSSDSEVYPDDEKEREFQAHLEKLEHNPYNGNPDNQYGIPTDFDVSYVCIKIKESNQKMLLVNVHVKSGPWNDDERAKQIKDWIIEEAIPLAQEECNGNIIIAGDFNHDEERQGDTESSRLMKILTEKFGLDDSAHENHEVTTNYPFFLKDYRYDHIFGICEFSNYNVEQSLLKADFKKLKRRRFLIWWMYLDHKMVMANFKL